MRQVVLKPVVLRAGWLGMLLGLLSGCPDNGGGENGMDGDGEPGGARDVVFSGGSIDDLRAINAALTFGHLEINGPLTLPISGASRRTCSSVARSC